MKKIYYSICGLFLMFFITSNTIKSTDSARLFEKTVFIELDYEEDSVLIVPYSKAWKILWQYSSDMLAGGSSLMNYEKYKTAFEGRMDNLWTLLHPKMIDGTIQSYYPYDPESYGMGALDDGELRYPINDLEQHHTFLTSEETRSDFSLVLGQFGPESDIPLTDEYGDPLTRAMSDGAVEYVYPPRDYSWFEDADILKYKLRVRIVLNKKGKEKKRIIQSISPVTNVLNEMNEIQGERDIVWLDFQELKPHLEEAYYFDENNKPISYLDHIVRKVKNFEFTSN